MPFRVGTAGWSIPGATAARFPPDGSHLERYGAAFSAVEINSSFYRPHRRATYAKWAASVPPDFRFGIKLPKTITHELRFKDCASLIERFAEEIGGLGDRLGPVLVQLPPSFAYPGDLAERFFEELEAVLDAVLVLEPRHESWFAHEVDRMLERRRVAQVAADPARSPAAAVPGGWKGVAYFRLHGSPRIYDSPYDLSSIESQASTVASLMKAGAEAWTIYDNTMHGAATENALQLRDILRGTLT